MILFLLNQSLRRCFMDLRSLLASCFFTLFAKNCRKYTAFSVIETLFAKIISSFILKKSPLRNSSSSANSSPCPQLIPKISPVRKKFLSSWENSFLPLEKNLYPGRNAKTPGYACKSTRVSPASIITNDQAWSLVMSKVGHC